MIPIIQIKDLHVRFENKQILSGINLDIHQGAFKLIIGPNGAGKTTLLKSILGMVRGYTGQILIRGQRLASFSPRERARMVGYVPQSLELSFNMDVQSFVELSRFAHDDLPKEKSAIIEESMAVTQTQHLQQALVNELSGGERQRVLIAAALAQKPRILVLDEPESSLDPGHRIELVELLKRLQKEQDLTILLVTHEWNEYATLFPEIVALKMGNVAFESRSVGLSEKLHDLYGCAFHHFQKNGIGFSFPHHN